MAHFHVYGIGAALVDTEIEVSDGDLAHLNIDKGLMTWSMTSASTNWSTTYRGTLLPPDAPVEVLQPIQ